MPKIKNEKIRKTPKPASHEYSIEEIVEYTDTRGRDRSLTRVVRDDGWPFALGDDGVIFPAFEVTEEDRMGIVRAVRDYINKRKNPEKIADPTCG